MGCVCVCMYACRPSLFSLSAIARACVRVCNNENARANRADKSGEKEKESFSVGKKGCWQKNSNPKLQPFFKTPVVVVVGDTTATTFAVAMRKNDGE